MAGTSQKTTTVGVRVPNEVLARWQVAAQAQGMPASSYVLHLAQFGAKAAEVQAAAASAQEMIPVLEAKIAELEGADSRLEIVERRLDEAGSHIKALVHDSAHWGQRAQVAEGQVTELLAEVDKWRGRAERAEQAAKVLADHKMITPDAVVNPRGRSVDLDSPKAVATILPITGTEFPRQLTHWQKQQAKPKKGKP